MASEECPPTPREPYTYCFRTASSIYKEVARVLSARPEWQLTKSDATCDLLLAERWEVPYARLGQARRQTVNHLRGSKHITVKALLLIQMRHYCEASGGAVPLSSMLPESYVVVPGGGPGDERALKAAPGPEDSIWICKPTAGCHGSGIRLLRGFQTALAFVDSLTAPAAGGAADGASVENVSDSSNVEHGGDQPLGEDKPKRTSIAELRAKAKAKRPAAWLVQAYVDRPLLICGRKFDIRALAVVAPGPALRTFWYRTWICRTCSEPYSPDDLDNRIKHISNHCVQTQAEAYGQHEAGNEMFTEDIERHLEEQRPGEGAALVAGLGRQMQGIVAHTVASLRDSAGGEGFDAFQALGYDFMVDADMKVWLLEVNGSPACAQRMLDADFARHLVEVAIDPLYPSDPPAPRSPSNQFEEIVGMPSLAA